MPPTIINLDFKPHPSCYSISGRFRLEAGWGHPSKLEGDLCIRVNKILKDPKVVLEFRGESGTCWLNTDRLVDPHDLSSKPTLVYGPRKIIKTTLQVPNAPLLDPNNVNKVIRIPFSIDLPAQGIPPSYEDLRGSIRYLLKATVQWSETVFGMKNVKFLEVPVQVEMPVANRLKLLTTQTVARHLEPTRPSERPVCSVAVPRSILQMGELVEAELSIISLPPDFHISAIKASVIRELEFCGHKTVKCLDDAPMAAFEAVIATDPFLADMSSSRKGLGWKRVISLRPEPTSMSISLRTPLITIQHYIEIAITSTCSAPNTHSFNTIKIRVPLAFLHSPAELGQTTFAPSQKLEYQIIQALLERCYWAGSSGIKEGCGRWGVGFVVPMEGVPVSPAVNVEKNVKKVTFQDMLPTVKNMIVWTDFQPRLSDEVKAVVGDHVLVNTIHDDGWAHATNLNTGKSGMLPLTVLVPDPSITSPTPQLHQHLLYQPLTPTTPLLSTPPPLTATSAASPPLSSSITPVFQTQHYQPPIVYMGHEHPDLAIEKGPEPVKKGRGAVPARKSSMVIKKMDKKETVGEAPDASKPLGGEKEKVVGRKRTVTKLRSDGGIEGFEVEMREDDGYGSLLDNYCFEEAVAGPEGTQEEEEDASRDSLFVDVGDYTLLRYNSKPLPPVPKVNLLMYSQQQQPTQQQEARDAQAPPTPPKSNRSISTYSSPPPPSYVVLPPPATHSISIASSSDATITPPVKKVGLFPMERSDSVSTGSSNPTLQKTLPKPALTIEVPPLPLPQAEDSKAETQVKKVGLFTLERSETISTGSSAPTLQKASAPCKPALTIEVSTPPPLQPQPQPPPVKAKEPEGLMAKSLEELDQLLLEGKVTGREYLIQRDALKKWVG
ncbi:hypothetical protein HDV05_001593 [Chytridiales sp. JEL 0842]|nr:hypothetical protein HDV05_001593 [Chytridiales sp. JEL 0842]